MPFLLIVIGIAAVATGANGTYAAFFAQLRSDMVGFTGYAAAIGGVGALGYVKDLEPLSRMFMALIIVSLILSNQGFFQKFAADLKAGPLSPQKPQDNLAGMPSSDNLAMLENSTNNAMALFNTAYASNQQNQRQAFNFAGTAAMAFL
jgi:hypothetical protein